LKSTDRRSNGQSVSRELPPFSGWSKGAGLLQAVPLPDPKNGTRDAHANRGRDRLGRHRRRLDLVLDPISLAPMNLSNGRRKRATAAPILRTLKNTPPQARIPGGAARLSLGQNAPTALVKGRRRISGERLFQNVTNRFLEKTVAGVGRVTVSLLQMTLNPRFHEPALMGFEIGYNRSRREYDHAAGTLQIHHSRF